MATFYSQATEYSGGMYTSVPIPMMPTLPKADNGESEVSSLLTTSLLLANGMETAVTSADLGLPLVDATWSTAPASSPSALQTQYSMVVTPPPEACSGFLPAYPYPVATPSWQDYGLPPNVSTMAATSTLTDCQLSESSLVYSPISSPGSTDSNLSIHEVPPGELPYVQPTMSTSSKSPSPLCYNVYSHANGYEPTTTVNGFSPTMVSGMENKNGLDFGKFTKEPRMPQRKGGIQLWQFLYSLLTNPEKKYKDIIEWTAKAHEKEFRMLEPESIAIWWGHHKNKPSMTYDKFSRSLRYYYDKGILKKIPGERYVYRFLIDPELMYHHIGTSDCRPKVKPMPQAAKTAMSKFHKTQNIDFKPEDMPIVTPEPETLEKSVNKISSIRTPVVHSTKTKPWMSAPSSKSSLEVSSPSLQSSSSTGNLSLKRSACFSDTNALPIKRCRSLESYPNFSQTESMQFLPSSCPALPYNSQFSDSLPEVTVHSHVHTIVSQVNKASTVSSLSNYYPSLCDSYYPISTSSQC